MAKKISLSNKIIIGAFLGVLVGLFFGESVSFMNTIGDIYIKLLQMTVLPYIIVSLISGIGRIESKNAKELVLKGGLLMLFFWALGFIFIFTVPFAFPEANFSSFFSPEIISKANEYNFIDVYIPSNLFKSLSENYIPAVVLFSIFLGASLVKIENKGSIINSFNVLASALSKVTSYIVKLTPYGLFALAAGAAGTMSGDEFSKIQVFFISFIILTVILTYWVLPFLVSIVTPFTYKEIVKVSRDALITAFFTGNLFVILPILTENIKSLFKNKGISEEKIESYIDIIIPVIFNFPKLGKLSIMLFIPFAAWYTGNNFSFLNYLDLASSGLISFFGSVNIAIPFLLDYMKLPQDMYQLFLVSTIITSKFSSLLGAMHLLTYTIILVSMFIGLYKVQWKKLLIFGVSTLILTIGVLKTQSIIFDYLVNEDKNEETVVEQMDNLIISDTVIVEHNYSNNNILYNSDSSHLSDVIERKLLTIGYLKENLPFTYFNKEGKLVGLDIDIISLFAKDIDCKIKFVPYILDSLDKQLNRGDFDIAISGIKMDVERMYNLDLTIPYLEFNTGLVVKDYKRTRFSSMQEINNMDSVVFAVVGIDKLYAKQIEAFLPNSHVVVLNSYKDFFMDKNNSFDALITSAEAGSAWTIKYPEYKVVVPQEHPGIVPIVFALKKGNREFKDFLSNWIIFTKSKPRQTEIYNHWILGVGAKKQTKRWSIAKDVLHWIK